MKNAILYHFFKNVLRLLKYTDICENP